MKDENKAVLFILHPSAFILFFRLTLCGFSTGLR